MVLAAKFEEVRLPVPLASLVYFCHHKTLASGGRPSAFKIILKKTIFQETWHVRSAQITALYSIGCQTRYVLTLQERPPPLSTFADLIPTLEVNLLSLY